MSVDRGTDPSMEQSWVEQTQKSDLVGFSKIVDAYQVRVYGFVRRMVRNDEDAQDVTQDVFVRAFQAIHKFDHRSSLRTWLFRIAYHLCVDLARRVDRSPKISALESGTEDEAPREFADRRWDPAEILMNQELQVVVEHALETMSDKLRTVIVLHDREDLGYEEIAQVVNVPIGTVKSRLFLARAHMQESVGRYLEGGRNP